ncbi:hypothetical protein [Moritella viscosa]|uniref:Adenylate kinase-ATP-AMP transphosphorylase n=1 Tax=Moritella viscosa TaxID=80854 RepID=A0ABY1HLA4_9GAMM|nr:hypothetical protein [Moritella viscosa]SGZ00411.1 Adenylate kinase-ATP-AMP transphosphorylase [Moritella viscosa]SHO28231.1 Adenylate kinase-ATP-AMP transphosphorylase [Moritella viscosa]
MEKTNGMAKWFYNFLKWDKWHFLAFVGAFLMIFCTKQIVASEMYSYKDLTNESKTSFLKNIKIVNFSINSYGYTFKYHCGGSWNNSEFSPSTNGKPHVLGDVMSYVRDQDKVEVIKFLSAECS